MQQATKSQKAQLIPNDMQGVSGIKLVKNANVFQQNGVYFCVHYETVIFAYDPKNNRVEANWNCSTTSNRQIRHCLRFFNLTEEQTIDTHGKAEGKWNYSRSIYAQ